MAEVSRYESRYLGLITERTAFCKKQAVVNFIQHFLKKKNVKKKENKTGGDIGTMPMV